MRAAPCESSVWIGTCQPWKERDEMPISPSTIAIRPAVTCSPDATTASYSRASCSLELSLTQPTSSLVLPDIAETTTETSLPASTSRLTCRAAWRMRSTLATDVPPNFITIRATVLFSSDSVRPSARKASVRPTAGFFLALSDRPSLGRPFGQPLRVPGSTLSNSAGTCHKALIEARNDRDHDKSRRNRQVFGHGRRLVGPEWRLQAPAQVHPGAPGV